MRTSKHPEDRMEHLADALLNRGSITESEAQFIREGAAEMRKLRALVAAKTEEVSFLGRSVEMMAMNMEKLRVRLEKYEPSGEKDA